VFLRCIIVVVTYLITTCSSYACERLKDTSTPSKLAIVIGNFGYKHSPLSTVNADIDAISGQLKKNGYTVDCYQNLYLADLTQLFAHITTSLLTYNGDFLLYLSGHGWNDGTDNYFLAVDVNLDNVNEYKQNLIDLDNVMKIFSTGSNSRQAVFIFDICRDNPTGVTTPIGIERNLQKYAPEAKDIIVAYSAGYGTVASDGEPGKYSPFAGALAYYLKPELGLSVQEILGFVQSHVKDRSREHHTDTQIPSFVSLAGREVLLDTRYTGLKGLRSPGDYDNIGAKPLTERLEHGELIPDDSGDLKDGEERRFVYRGFATLMRNQLSKFCKSHFDDADRAHGSKQVFIYRMPREVFKEKWAKEVESEKGAVNPYLLWPAVSENVCAISGENNAFYIIGRESKTGNWKLYLEQWANRVFTKSTGEDTADVIFMGNQGLGLKDVTLYTFDINEWKFLREDHVTVTSHRADPFAVNNEEREWLGSKTLDEQVPSSPMFKRGLDDRTAWESWISGLSSDYRAGVDYWAGQRSSPHPGNCQGTPEFISGCTAAKERLASIDTLRKSEPDYRLGWNAYGH